MERIFNTNIDIIEEVAHTIDYDESVRKLIHKYLVHEVTQQVFVKQATDKAVKNTIKHIQQHMMDSSKFMGKDFQARLDDHFFKVMYKDNYVK